MRTLNITQEIRNFVHIIEHKEKQCKISKLEKTEHIKKYNPKESNKGVFVDVKI